MVFLVVSYYFWAESPLSMTDFFYDNVVEVPTFKIVKIELMEQSLLIGNIAYLCSILQA